MGVVGGGWWVVGGGWWVKKLARCAADVCTHNPDPLSPILAVPFARLHDYLPQTHVIIIH